MTPIRKIVALATAAIAVVTLSACDVNAGVGIHEDGTADIAMEFHDTDGLLGTQGLTSCDDIAKQISQEALKEIPQGNTSEKDIKKVMDSLEITDVSKGDELGCSVKFTTPDSIIDGDKIKETDSTFIIDARNPGDGEVVPPQQIKLFSQFVNLKLVISTPGDIIKADGATIDGNRAIYTDIESLLKNGVYIEGNKTGNDDFSGMLSVSSSSGLPTWAWILIGVVILVVIVALIFFMIRKKPQGDTLQAPAYGFTPQPNQPGQPEANTPQAPTYGFTPQPNHHGQPAATNTPAPTAQPSTIPTQNHSHTMPTPQATPGAQPFAQMQRQLDHDLPNIPGPTQTPQPPLTPLAQPNPQTLEGNNSADGTNWNNSGAGEDQLS